MTKNSAQEITKLAPVISKLRAREEAPPKNHHDKLEKQVLISTEKRTKGKDCNRGSGQIQMQRSRRTLNERRYGGE